MMLIDTHTHLFSEQFDEDRREMVQRAIDAGIKKMFLPNIDVKSIQSMLDLCKEFSGNCFPMIGLHPGSVEAENIAAMQKIEEYLSKEKFYAIGECGLDFYWDLSFKDQQMEVLKWHFDQSVKYGLPLVLHTRESTSEVIRMIKDYPKDLRGVFHCFSGTLEQAHEIIEMGFFLGIGGVLTYKKSTLPEIINQLSLEHIVLETDSPYLSPVPMRGKRNESSYLIHIANKLAEIKSRSLEEISEITSTNANRLFNSGENL